MFCRHRSSRVTSHPPECEAKKNAENDGFCFFMRGTALCLRRSWEKRGAFSGVRLFLSPGTGRTAPNLPRLSGRAEEAQERSGESPSPFLKDPH